VTTAATVGATGCTPGCSTTLRRTGPRSTRGRRLHGPTSWGEACSARYVASGIGSGRAGGVTIRRSTPRPSCLLTHHPRDLQPMDGGTTYHFVTDGIESALAQAREAAGDGDVSIEGGASTINQYLAAGLIDELRQHIVPLTLGAGTRLFDGVPPLNLEQVDSRAASSVTHVTYRVLS